MRRILILAALGLVLAACGNPRPPVGKWEGVLDQPDALVAARVEIGPRGEIFISAPKFGRVHTTDAYQLAQFRTRLAEELSVGWSDVSPVTLDFDGEKFTRPGEAGPQMLWDNGPGRLILIVHLAPGDDRRVQLRPVREFSDDPFAPYKSCSPFVEGKECRSA